MALSILSSVAELEPFRDGWNRLAARSGNALLDLDWFESCLAISGSSPTVKVLVAHRQGEVVGVAPLLATGMRLTMATDRGGEPQALLAADDNALTETLHGIRQLNRPVRLARLAVSSPEVAAMRRLRGRSGWMILESDRTQTAFVSLEGPPVEERMSSSSRTQLRRLEKKAKALGGAEVEFVYPAEAEVEHWVRELTDVESSGWKARAGTSLRQNPDKVEILLRQGRRLAARGELHVGIYRIGGRPAAIRFAAERYRRLWEFKIGYHEDFRACYPGLLLTHETLRFLPARGVRAHMFLGRYEKWQDLWRPEVVDLASYTLYPVSVVGSLALAASATGRTCRPALARARAMLAGIGRPRAAGSEVPEGAEAV